MTWPRLWPVCRSPSPDAGPAIRVNGVTHPGSGIFWLLGPKVRSKLSRSKTEERSRFKWGMLGFVGLFFWAFIFGIIFRMLLYFRGTQGIGDLLAAKLLGLALLTFLMILLLSNVITALSTFFLSQDMELLVAAPVDSVKLYGARLVETIVNSSWMVALLTVPLLVAYGVVYGASWSFYGVAVATIIPYLVLPAVAGAAFTLMLVNVFPARRTRDLLALISLFAAAGVVMLFRFLRPERLVPSRRVSRSRGLHGGSADTDVPLAPERVGGRISHVPPDGSIRPLSAGASLEYCRSTFRNRGVAARSTLPNRLHPCAGGGRAAKGRGTLDHTGAPGLGTSCYAPTRVQGGSGVLPRHDAVVAADSARCPSGGVCVQHQGAAAEHR